MEQPSSSGSPCDELQSSPRQDQALMGRQASEPRDEAVKSALAPGSSRAPSSDPAAPAEKLCTSCGAFKASSSFARDPSRPGGLVSRCKACSSCKQDTCTTKARPTVMEPTVTERACSSCKQIKPASEFVRDPRRTTGLDSRCKMCRRAAHKARQQQLHDNPLPKLTEQQCRGCKAVKPMTDFARQTHSKTGFNTWCRDCMCEKRREKAAERSRTEPLEQPLVQLPQQAAHRSKPQPRVQQLQVPVPTQPVQAALQPVAAVQPHSPQAGQQQQQEEAAAAQQQAAQALHEQQQQAAAAEQQQQYLEQQRLQQQHYERVQQEQERQYAQQQRAQQLAELEQQRQYIALKQEQERQYAEQQQAQQQLLDLQRQQQLVQDLLMQQHQQHQQHQQQLASAYSAVEQQELSDYDLAALDLPLLEEDEMLEQPVDQQQDAQDGAAGARHVAGVRKGGRRSSKHGELDGFKTCTKCKETKPRDHFSRDSTKRCGVSSRCKPCEANYRREKKRAARERSEQLAAAAREEQQQQHLQEQQQQQQQVAQQAGQQRLQTATSEELLAGVMGIDAHVAHAAAAPGAGVRSGHTPIPGLPALSNSGGGQLVAPVSPGAGGVMQQRCRRSPTGLPGFGPQPVVSPPPSARAYGPVGNAPPAGSALARAMSSHMSAPSQQQQQQQQMYGASARACSLGLDSSCGGGQRSASTSEFCNTTATRGVSPQAGAATAAGVATTSDEDEHLSFDQDPLDSDDVDVDIDVDVDFMEVDAVLGSLQQPAQQQQSRAHAQAAAVQQQQQQQQAYAQRAAQLGQGRGQGLTRKRASSDEDEECDMRQSSRAHSSSAGPLFSEDETMDCTAVGAYGALDLGSEALLPRPVAAVPRPAAAPVAVQPKPYSAHAPAAAGGGHYGMGMQCGKFAAPASAAPTPASGSAGPLAAFLLGNGNAGNGRASPAILSAVPQRVGAMFRPHSGMLRVSSGFFQPDLYQEPSMDPLDSDAQEDFANLAAGMLLPDESLYNLGDGGAPSSCVV